MARILILANNDVGLYKFRRELIETLIKRGEQLYISLPHGHYIEKLSQMGCIFIETPIDRRGTNPITDMKLLINYTKLIKTIKPDVVLTYTIKPNVYGGIACQLTNTSFLANVTGLGTSIENGGFLQRITLILYTFGLRKAHCVFFQNELNKKFLENSVVKSRTKLIPGSGVNIDHHNFEEYPIDNGVIRFLFIGRIMKSKGIDELFKAAQIIKTSFPNTEFHFVGGKEEDYDDRLNELTKKEIIFYHGLQESVHTFIKDCHATINPSYHEGMSNVLLESASTGRPVLASNVPGCMETFDEGISGFGFEVKNVDSLVKTIIKFIELPYEQKKAMGIAGRKKMEKEFERNLVTQAYLEEIRQATGRYIDTGSK